MQRSILSEFAERLAKVAYVELQLFTQQIVPKLAKHLAKMLI
jgi:hypothetical protein